MAVKSGLEQGWADFFCKEESSKYFRLWRLCGLFQLLRSAAGVAVST